MWHKKVWFVSDKKNDYCSSRPKSYLEQKNWTDIKMSPQEQVYYKKIQIEVIWMDMGYLINGIRSTCWLLRDIVAISVFDVYF